MIEVLRPGQYSTIQDVGRYGYRNLGVPVSGPMDKTSALLANRLLGNESTAPILEMSRSGAKLLFHERATIVFTGADADIFVNDEPVQSHKVINVSKNSIVSIDTIHTGNFLYMSIVGGFICDAILGSVSYYKGLTQHTRLEKGQELCFNSDLQLTKLPSATVKRQHVDSSNEITVMRGPEFHLLTSEHKNNVISNDFSISLQSNRMGFQLNEKLDVRLPEIISSPVQPGTIQLTTGGQLIVLMRDAQTTGGYSRILQLTEKSINKFAQIRFGKPFQFRLTD